MKSLEEVIRYYHEYETPYDDRFGRRFCKFLTSEQMERIGYTCIGGFAPLAWTEKNVLKQLKEDVILGQKNWKQLHTITAEAMYQVCCSWCLILENGMAYEPFGTYKRSFFDRIAEKYGWDLKNEK